jgi:enterochelin esterase-like enzyme
MKTQKVSKNHQSTKTYFFLFIALWLLWALMMSPVAFAAGRVEYQQTTSKILADAGEVSTRELGVSLPDGYDTSGLEYPVLYLIHGHTGNDRTFLGSGYSGWMSGVNVNLIVDKLIETAKIQPLIVILPTFDMSTGLDPNDKYLTQELIPLVDKTYRTIPRREGRAISGHSRGGHAAYHIAFSYPEMFSLVGGYAAGSLLGPLPGRDIITAHNQKLFPLRFWIYAGTNDQYQAAIENREFVEILKEVDLPYVYIEDDGDHTNKIAQRLEESIVYFSQFLGNSQTAVQPRGKLTTTWGEVKRR